VKGKVKLALILGALGLLISLLGVLPASGGQGQVVILDGPDGDAIVWSNPGETVFVQITDSDLNVAVPTEDEFNVSCLDGTPTPETHEQSAGPVLDTTKDGRVSSKDVTVFDGVSPGGREIRTGDVDAVTVTRVDTAEDILTVGCDGTFTERTVFFRYDAPGANIVGTKEDSFRASIVKVSSDADEAGIGIQLSEVIEGTDDPATDTGVFGISLVLCDTEECSDANSSPPRIEVATEVNDVLTITYDDVGTGDSSDTITISIENIAPEFANFAPAHEFATTTGRPTLSGDVSDVDSGVLQNDLVDETIAFVVRATEIDGTTVLIRARSQDPAGKGTVDETDDVFSVTQRVPSDLVSDEDVYLIQWWIVAEDIAGNKGVSDEDSETECKPDAFTLDTDTTGGGALADCEPYVIRIDFTAPTISSAVTGNSWDPEDEVVLSDADAVNTSIQVIFDAALDGDTVSVGDFDSSDVDIQSLDWFSDAPESVFLTVDAMDSDAEPRIDLISEVSDEAGNDEDDATVEADDGIPAALTVTVTGTANGARAVTPKEITVRVEADESLTGSPTIYAYRIGAGSDTTGGNLAAGAVSLAGKLAWEATFDVDNPGLYNVFVTSRDLGARIVSTKGLDGSASDTNIDLVDNIDDAILFEVDTGIPAPTTTPADGKSTDDTTPFIILDFSDEGQEYGLTAVGTGGLTVDPDTVVDNFDDHATVTISAATLDGADITMETDDDIVFLYKAPGLALGSHEVIVTYQDEAGNQAEDFAFSFDVEARAPFSINLVPGWNLISLPGQPADTAIDAVIGTTIPVTAVYGFDPTSPGDWLVAVRERQDDGTFGPFAGPLKAIDANHGYWVLTTTFQSIDVDIPTLAGGAAAGGLPPQPPTITIFAGWNLVPVRDVVGNAVAGDEIDADDYFAGLEISRVYGYDTVNDVWNAKTLDGDAALVATDEDENIEVGKAYWVFATAVGALVP
jgi:hypothetical protein